MISLKKKAWVFSWPSETHAEISITLTWHRSLWLASHRVWEIHGAECLGKHMEPQKKQGHEWPRNSRFTFWWYEKNRRKNQQNINTSASKGCSLFSHQKRKKGGSLRTSWEMCFLVFYEFFVDVFSSPAWSTDFVAKNRDLFFVWGTKLVELEYRPCFLPFVLWKSDAPRLFWVLTWT